MVVCVCVIYVVCVVCLWLDRVVLVLDAAGRELGGGFACWM